MTIKTYLEIYNDDQHLAEMCEFGNLCDVKDALTKSSFSSLGLHRACRRGDKIIIDECMKNGPTDINWGFVEACIQGNLNIAKHMIEKYNANDFDRAIIGATISKNKELIAYLYEQKVNKILNTI